MKFLFWLVVILVLAFGGWTYYHLYKFSEALVENDSAGLAHYVNLDSIRAQHQKTAPPAPPTPPVSGMTAGEIIQKSIENIGSAIPGAPPPPPVVIDMEWVRTTLGRPTNGQLGVPSFAFFESPLRFLLRYGELGYKPVHAYMRFEDWRWRLTEIYE